MAERPRMQQEEVQQSDDGFMSLDRSCHQANGQIGLERTGVQGKGEEAIQVIR